MGSPESSERGREGLELLARPSVCWAVIALKGERMESRGPSQLWWLMPVISALKRLRLSQTKTRGCSSEVKQLLRTCKASSLIPAVIPSSLAQGLLHIF